jgi:MYXO-CTERM domain-containing protein
MRNVFAWLGAATLASLVLASPPVAHVAHAAPPTALKPYVVLILDTSGSMAQATGSGVPSCGGADTKLDHARCAINKIANSYGDMVLALGRFRETTSGTYPSCTMTGVDCNACQTNGTGCTTAMASDTQFEVLSPLLDGSNSGAATFTDFVQGTCGNTLANQPEIWTTAGFTPIAGTLKGDKRYWQGLQATDGTVLWPSGTPGFDPITNDPMKNAFLPSGEQCRPYITILLTDGAETCSGYATGDPYAPLPNTISYAVAATTAAAGLLTTTVGGKTYRVVTKPIGFGVGTFDQGIEDLAHAGGAADLPGVNEGFYAADEAGLELALSKIIEDSLRTEKCNGLDDNCNGLIDEDFPNKGMACDNGQLGACRGTGVYVCRADGSGTQCNITNPGAMSTTEICNGIDDNCNGLIDEGNVCPPGCGNVEICNGLDDNCNGQIDEGLTRPCGSNLGVCTAGTETCVLGVWQGCTATGGSTETCNGKDDNCDGVIDGFSQACSTMPPINGNPAGAPGNNPNMGLCHPGSQICPANGNGMFGSCLGEVKPVPEVCNGVDDNCNGQIDEGTGGGSCSSACGTGTISCVNGQLVCNSTGTMPEICNGIDDDCNGLIDDGLPLGPACTTATVCNGHMKCIGGTMVCTGPTIGVEQCNCQDDNCNGQVDEGNLCGAGSTCSGTYCECVFPCAAGEFPCPAGKECKTGVCVTDPCYQVNCPAVGGAAQVCKAGACVDACAQVSCNPGSICVPATGQCAPDDCSTFPDRCNAMQNCINGQCVTNLCIGVTCPSTQYCVGGNCVDTCVGVTCPANQRCQLGVCQPDPCGHPCPFGQACNTGTQTCQNDPCLGRSCPGGQWCNPDNGQCQDDPCVGTKCPVAGEVCVGGTCYDPAQLQPDAGVGQYVTTGGGGGCATTGADGGLLAGLLGLAAFIMIPRRRRGGRA